MSILENSQQLRLCVFGTQSANLRFAMPTGRPRVLYFTLAPAISLLISFLCAHVQASDIDLKAPHSHWHEYVNRKYGISLLYPDPYKPIAPNGRCKDNYYREYLLCLGPTVGSDPVISVSVIVAVPFHVSPGAGDLMPTRQRIGRHLFYCGVVGSMGVGFSDSCVFNLRGKTLEFEFNPLDGVNVTDETKRLEPTMLKTLQIF